MPFTLPAIKRVFGDTTDIADRVRAFDFSTINPTNGTESDYLRADLAPSYGDLNKDTISEIDDATKALISIAMTKLQHLRAKTFEAVVSSLAGASQFESEEEVRTDEFIKMDPGFFRGDDENVVDEVYTWFRNYLVHDYHAVKSTGIDKDLMARIVTQTETIIKNTGQRLCEQPLLRIGVFQFPDDDGRDLQVYSLKLVATYHGDHVGIYGKYLMRSYRVRDRVMAAMRAEYMEHASKELQSMFDAL